MRNNTSSTSRKIKRLAAFGRKGMVEGVKWETALAIAGYTGGNIVQLRPPDTTPALEAAMGYVIHFGWKVFPVDVAARKSYLSAKHAPGGMPWGMTDDPEQLRRNFLNPKWRDVCGVGVATGAVNRIWDIEGDTMEAHGKDGLASLKKLETDHGELPDTLMAESPSGSLHRIYGHPGHGRRVISRANALPGYPGIDVKGDGGMFIAPPSVRSDGVYKWLNSKTIAEAPESLLKLVCEPEQSTSSRAIDNLKRYGDSVRGKTSLDKLTFMLMEVIPNTVEKGRDHWIKVGHALKYERPDDDGLQLWLEFSSKFDGEFDGDTDEEAREEFVIETWNGLKPKRITGGSLYWLCDEADPEWRNKYAARQVEQAEFICDAKGNILRNATNIRTALVKLGVSVRHDQFADRMLIDGLPGFGPALEDAAVNRLWLLLMEHLHFPPTLNLELVRIVVSDMARLNGFHPVRNYLDSLQWDGQPRVDQWLITYAGAEDSAYVQAVGALLLIAAVRRVRQPGCKFDEMLVLEQPLQGTDKSSALAVLAVNEDWFADDLPLNVEAKRVIEVLRGRWIVEAAELSGMRKADVEHLKATLSRRIDRARMAYGRLTIEAPRQCIFVGTTNKGEYLRDTTGNRRFWPVLVQAFKLDELRRDRDQLWAEACVREAKGESIRLAPELWPEAAKEQEQRLADDPYVEVLRHELGHLEGGHKIRARDVWEILNLHGAQLTQDAYQRSAEAMKRIGWRRPNKAGIARFGGQLMSAFIQGDGRWAITAERSQYGLTVRSEKEIEEKKAEEKRKEAEIEKRHMKEEREKKAAWKKADQKKKAAAAERNKKKR